MSSALFLGIYFRCGGIAEHRFPESRCQFAQWRSRTYPTDDHTACRSQKSEIGVSLREADTIEGVSRAEVQYAICDGSCQESCN